MVAEALDGGLGSGRQVDGETDAKSLESRAGLQWFVGRFGSRRGGGAGGLCDRDGNLRQYCFTLPSLRCDGLAAHVWTGESVRLYGLGLELRQDRPVGSGCRGLCTDIGCDPRF